MTIDEAKKHKTRPKIKVVGVGTSGIKAVNHMITCGMQGVEFIAVDADIQALLLSKAQTRIQIGEKLLNGLDAGQYSEFGKDAVELSKDMLIEQLQGADMVFITTGMGSNTGSSAAPVLAEYAREVGALTVGVVTEPFSLEGKRRMNQAEAGIVLLKDAADAVITISGDSLLQFMDQKASVVEAFHFANEVMRRGIQGISDIFTANLIKADFEDVKTILENAGSARMSIGTAKGEDGATAAVKAAVKKARSLNLSFKGAFDVLLNMTGGANMTMDDIEEAENALRETVDPDANIVVGATKDNNFAKDEFQITVIAVRCPGISVREVCRNCKGSYFKGDKYCRFCGAPMGKPEYIEEIILFLYGPPPPKQVHTCDKCGYSWETYGRLADEIYGRINNVNYCPKCGGDKAKLVSEEDWYSKIFEKG